MRRSCAAQFLLVGLALGAARAQEATLRLGPAPDGWTARPAGDKPYLGDWDLPAVAGEDGGPRVNVLPYPLGLEEYRAKILGRWRRADGSALELGDQRVAALEVPGLRVTVIDQAGEHRPREGAPHAGWRLLAAHIEVDQAGGPARWTAWLIGPARGVEAARAGWLAWLGAARSGEAAREARLDQPLRFVHGAPAHGVPGPWAQLGLRIGTDALARLGARRADGWQLIVTVRAPEGHPLRAALDGLLVATGTSPGQGNLRFVASDGQPEVELIHRPSGRALTYRPLPELAERLNASAPDAFPRAADELAEAAPEALWRRLESREGGDE